MAEVEELGAANVAFEPPPRCETCGGRGAVVLCARWWCARCACVEHVRRQGLRELTEEAIASGRLR